MAEAQLPREAENGEAVLPAPASLEAADPPRAESDAPERNGDAGAESVIILPPPLPTNEIAAREPIADAPASDEAAPPDGSLASLEPEQTDETVSSREDGLPQVAEPHGDAAPVNGLAEISPIFSAIDAAERVAAAQQPWPDPQFNAFEVGLVVSRPDVPSGGYDAEVAAPAAEEDSRPEPASEPAPAEADALSAQDTWPVVDDVPPDTAAKIAEEANATAVALEALRQLLAEKLPELESAAARNVARVPPVPGSSRALHAPVSPPPMVSAHVAAAALPYARQEPPRRRAAMVGSFFAGFSLSWVVGAVLYMFLTAG